MYICLALRQRSRVYEHTLYITNDQRRYRNHCKNFGGGVTNEKETAYHVIIYNTNPLHAIEVRIQEHPILIPPFLPIETSNLSSEKKTKLYTTRTLLYIFTIYEHS